MKWTDRRNDADDAEGLDDATEMALRDGLRAQPAPAVSPEFDARVLRAVHGRSPFWDVIVSSLRPAIATAAASTAITTLVLTMPNRPNPALAAAPPPSHVTTDSRNTRMREALAAGAYVGFEPLRDAPSGAPARKPLTPGG